MVPASALLASQREVTEWKRKEMVCGLTRDSIVSSR